MSNFDPAVDPPERLCPDKLGGILAAFPAVPLPTHERAGSRFTPPPCGQALQLDPDFCITTVKMDPESWRPEREAILNALQSAVNCSFGVTDEELRQEARNAIEQNLSRAIEADLVTALAAEAVSGGAGFTATCALAEAAMFLASQGSCQTGVIMGPVDWFTALTKDSLIWNGKFHTDVSGNIVIPHSVDNATVFAFDSNVIIKVSDVELLDEFMPGQRERNDRVVRGEMVYTISLAPCVVGSWTFTCCSCGGGGGGGGSDTPCNCQFEITNFPPNQNVTVTNPTFSTSVDDEALCDDNGVFFRRVTDDGQGTLTVTTVDVSGNPYAPVGTVTDCASDAAFGDTEFLEVCDGGNNNQPFIVVVTYDATGTPTNIQNLGYDGLPYAAVGPINRCPGEESDFFTTILCDGSNSFQRIYQIDTQTGLVVATTDVDDDGSPYVPLGPTTLGACSPRVRSQHFDVVPGSPWTSALVSPGGAITSLSYSILNGTADLVDFNGTSVLNLPAGLSGTWNNDLEGNLSPVASITADVGSRVYVQWTERF